MLEFDHREAEGARDGSPVAVLLHGRGSHRGDLQGLGSRLPDAWTLVTPQAPHPGEAWGYGPGWAWYRYLAEDRVDGESLERSLEALDAFLDTLPATVGFTPGPLILGGFSQGGTVSMAWAFTRPGRATAALNFSGFLVDGPLLDGDVLSPRSTPVFWGHGLQDPAIPHALAERGRARLTGAGVPHQGRDYPIGHWIAPDEVEDAVTFARTVAGGSASPS